MSPEAIAMPFKDFDDLLKPDPRFANCSAGDPANLFRPMAFQDHYGMAAEILLTSATPDHVYEMFDRARHTYVFAWFDYELTVVADQYALATLEGALKSYFGSTQTLRPLLERAVKAGIVPKYLHSGYETAKYLAILRNHWAHGNNGFDTPGMSATTLAICAEVIRRLYPVAQPNA
jgi:hypothetical protein